jgi:hypothetical protein
MTDIALTLPAEPVSQLLPGAGQLLGSLRSVCTYLAFASSVGFTLAVVLGVLN